MHLPLSWDDPATREAIHRYMSTVRADAPWCPWNIEFIRRINGLDSVDDVKRIVYDASYLVLGLGDVYLGAPVATPLDPRHRLVTTKYNPARTWTPENAVGIGGAYLCIYGMEGPGRLSVRRPHRAGVESLPPHRGLHRAVAAAILRPAAILRSRRRGAARLAARRADRPRRAPRRALDVAARRSPRLRPGARARDRRVPHPPARRLQCRTRALGRGRAHPTR